jgi:hypothetical protein
MQRIDCKGYICGKFSPEECICETRDVEVRLEVLRTQLIDAARMTDDITKYFFDQLIDEMLEIKNLLEKLNGESDTSRKDT